MDAKLKHLEFIQAVISRMSTSSFLFKGWAITIAASLSAFGAVDDKAPLLAIAAISTLLFWGLDAYYLWLERRFIDMYKAVAATPTDQINFDMTPDKSHAFRGWFQTCWRWHLLFFYGVIVVVDVIGIFIVRSK
jgi:hypothetical protein